MASGSTPLPAKLQGVVDDFALVPAEMRIEILVEYSEKVPPLPERFTDGSARMEEVPECQTPFFLATEVDEDGRVSLWFDSPPQSPTTRGFAGILSEGLNGATVEEVLSVPNGFYERMGLAEAISPLRLHALDAILGRLKRQLETST